MQLEVEVEDRFLRLTTAARLFDLPPATLKRWLRERRLTTYRMGRGLRVSLGELRGFVKVESEAERTA